MSLDKIKDRLKKLILKAQSAEEIGSLEEAETFSSKVNELLLQYNLQKSEINLENVEDGDFITEDKEGFEANRKFGDWSSKLIFVLCEHNLCHSILTTWKKINKYKIVLIGQPENIEIVTYLYQVLHSQLDKLAKSEWNTFIKDFESGYRSHAPSREVAALVFQLDLIKRLEDDDIRVTEDDIKRVDSQWTLKKPWKYKLVISRQHYIKSFLLGATIGIRTKLEKDKADFGALIKYNKDKIQEFLDQEHPGIGQQRRKQMRVDPKVYQLGIEAGKNSQITRGLSDTDKPSQKQLK